MLVKMLSPILLLGLISFGKGSHFAPRRDLVERDVRSAVGRGSIKRGAQQVYKKNSQNVEYDEVNKQLINSRLDIELASRLPLNLASDTEVAKEVSLQQALDFKNALKQSKVDMDGIQSILNTPAAEKMQHKAVSAQNAQSAVGDLPEPSSEVNGQFDNAPSDGKAEKDNKLNGESLMTSAALGQFNDGFPENDYSQSQSQSQSNPTQSMQLNDLLGPNSTPAQALGHLVAPPMPPTTRVVMQDANGLLKPLNLGHDGVGKPVGQLRQEFFSHGITQNVLNRMMFGGMRDMVAARRQRSLFSRSTNRKNNHKFTHHFNNNKIKDKIKRDRFL